MIVLNAGTRRKRKHFCKPRYMYLVYVTNQNSRCAISKDANEASRNGRARHNGWEIRKCDICVLVPPKTRRRIFLKISPIRVFPLVSFVINVVSLRSPCCPTSRRWLSILSTARRIIWPIPKYGAAETSTKSALKKCNGLSSLGLRRCSQSY